MSSGKINFFRGSGSKVQNAKFKVQCRKRLRLLIIKRAAGVKIQAHRASDTFAEGKYFTSAQPIFHM